MNRKGSWWAVLGAAAFTPPSQRAATLQPMRPSADEPVKPMSSADYIPCARTCGSRRLSEVEQEGVASRPVYVTAEGLDRLRAQLGILIASKRVEQRTGRESLAQRARWPGQSGTSGPRSVGRSKFNRVRLFSRGVLLPRNRVVKVA
jgi:hypothetical protein